MIFNKKGFKEFYTGLDFSKKVMKSEFLTACGIYGTLDTRWWYSDEEMQNLRQAENYILERNDTLYYRREEVSLFRLLVSPLCIFDVLFYWVFKA